MRKHLFLLVFGLIPLVVGAQVTINAQLPPAGLVQKDQLWNLNIVNNKEDALEVNIKMILRDALSGQAILSANTGNLIISKGIKIITSRDLQPIQYNYDLQGFSRTYLPMGSYDACYRLYNVNQKGEEPLGDDCIKFTIDPLSPPLLNSPSNESEIESHYPHFTWMPPAPYDMFSDLNYEILLTEVLPGQSASEAIQYNTALYDRSNINATYENYPASFEKLDTGKVYAWQVIAKNGMNYSAKTEVWKFKLRKEDQPKLATYDNVYILLQDDLQGTYAISKGILHVKYFSFNNEYSTMVLFKDLKGNIIFQEKRAVVPGDNYFDFKINDKCHPNNIYQVNINDLSGKTHVLRFSIVKS